MKIDTAEAQPALSDVEKHVCANGGDSADVRHDSNSSLCKHSDQKISFTVRLRLLHSHITASTHVDLTDKNC